MINCIYIHIPFCKIKCPYCAFCSFQTLRLKDEYINALIEEIKYNYAEDYAKTIYFGGGTPSLLEVSDIEKILNCFNYDSKTSVTLEANPLDLNIRKLKDFKKIGVNRISIGAQSFDNEILALIGRKHTKEDIYNAVENSFNAGFENISIDLMYGLPEQNIENWKETLKKVLDLCVAHISLYGLKIEEGTKFYRNLPKNLPSNDTQADMYELAAEVLKDKYKHYEFSNYAKDEKFYSIHNLAYWKRENYYGFGLSASGFIGNSRYTNTFNISEYIKNPKERIYEKLTLKEELEEEMFLGLRLSDGIDFSCIKDKYNIDIHKKYKKIFDKYIKYNYMKYTEKGIKLTLKGAELSNEILCEFIEI